MKKKKKKENIEEENGEEEEKGKEELCGGQNKKDERGRDDTVRPQKLESCLNDEKDQKKIVLDKRGLKDKLPM